MLCMLAAAVEPDPSGVAPRCLLGVPAMAGPYPERAGLVGPVGVDESTRRLPPDALYRILQCAHNLGMLTMHLCASWSLMHSQGADLTQWQ
jgi:hypothetical protein